MMLGRIVEALTNIATVDEAVAAIATADVWQRIETAAEAESTATGVLVASRVRHLIEHGGEDIWLELLGVMSGSPQPGAAAIERILARAFPIPVRVSAKRSGEHPV